MLWQLGRAQEEKELFIEQEAAIVNQLKILSNIGLNPLQLRKVIFDYAEALKITHTFNKEKKLRQKLTLGISTKKSVCKHSKTSSNKYD